MTRPDPGRDVLVIVGSISVALVLIPYEFLQFYYDFLNTS